MVSYPLNKQDPVEQKSRIKNVTFCQMVKHVLVTLALLCKVFYVQHLIFYKNLTDQDVPSNNYLISTLVSSMVTMSFVIRFFVLHEPEELTTIIISVLIVCTGNTFFTAYQTGSDEFNNYSIAMKVLYAVIFAPVVLFLQTTSLLPQVMFTKYVILNKFTPREDDGRQTINDNMMQQETNAGLVALLDCYLRAAPQMIIQIAIILHGLADVGSVSELQVGFNIIAFVMMPWSVTSFQGSLRLQSDHEFTTSSRIPYYLWHFCIMVSRITSISGAIAFWPYTTIVLILVHWIVATVWIWFMTEPTEFCGMKKTWHFLFCCVFGAVYFFNPVNLDQKRTRTKYTWFYTAILIENSLAITGYMYEDKEMLIKWKVWFVVVNVGSFIIGIISMISYYSFCHPTKKSYQGEVVTYTKSSQIIEDESFQTCTIK